MKPRSIPVKERSIADRKPSVTSPPSESSDGRFSCTRSPVLRASQRRFMALLWGLAAAVLAAGTYAWQSGRPLPALLATAAAALVLLAWRMSGDLDPVAIWIEGTYLVIQTRRHLLRRAVSGAPVRRLEKNEIDHLQQLASTGVFMTTAGGFDSRHLGEFDLFASNLDNAVLVDLGDERIIITPDEPERFVATLNG